MSARLRRQPKPFRPRNSVETTCLYPFIDGRTCRLPRSPHHSYLCVFHADRERDILNRHQIEHPSEDFLLQVHELLDKANTSTGLNELLQYLFSSVNAGLVTPRVGNLLGKLTYQLGQTLRGVDAEYWRRQTLYELQQTLPKVTPRPGRPASPHQQDEEDLDADEPCEEDTDEDVSEGDSDVPNSEQMAPAEAT